MRFLDPDESLLRILPSDQPRSKNPFAADSHHSATTTGTGGGGGDRPGNGSGDGDGGDGRGAGEVGGHSQGVGGGGVVVGESSKEDRAEAEDFNTLTDSIGL